MSTAAVTTHGENIVRRGDPFALKPAPLTKTDGRIVSTSLEPLRRVGAERKTEQEREKMVLLHLPQVRLVAKSIWDRARFAVELDDLVGYGVMGLLNAIQRYDPARGILLKTYAEYRIRGAILDGLRGMDWLPRSARQKERENQQRRREIEIASGDFFGNGTKGIEKSACNTPAGGRVPRMEFVFAGGNLTDLEKLAEKKRDGCSNHHGDGNPETLYQRKEECQRLGDAIAYLPRRHREVIELYYHQELSMRQIAQRMRVHESRVSQLHAAAIHRLRNHFSAGKAAPAPVLKSPHQPYSPPPRSRLSKYRVTASQSSSVSTPMVSSAVSATRMGMPFSKNRICSSRSVSSNGDGVSLR